MKFKQLTPQKKKSTKLLNKINCPEGHWYAFDGDIVDGVVRNRIFFIRDWVKGLANVIVIASYDDSPFTITTTQWAESLEPSFTYTEVEVDLSNILVGVRN